MKKWMMVGLVLYLALVAKSQNSNAHWDISNYIWSHTHHDPTLPGKPLIDFDSMDNWKLLGRQLAVSPDGRYIAYDVEKGVSQSGNKIPAEIIVQSIDNSWRQILIPQKVQSIGFFSSDSKQYIFEDKGGLCFLKLGSNERSYIKDFESYKVPFEIKSISNTANKWIATCNKNRDLILRNLINGKQKLFSEISSYNFDRTGCWLICQSTDPLPELMLYNLEDNQEYRFQAPKSYLFLPNVKTLLLNRGDKLEYLQLGADKETLIWKAKGKTESLASINADKKGSQVVFVVNNLISEGNKNSSNSIWYWKESTKESQKILDDTSPDIKDGLAIQEKVEFSDNGEYIVFSMQKPDEEEMKKGSVKLVIWSSKDKLLQSAQAAQGSSAKPLNAVLNPVSGKVLYVNSDDEFSFIQGDYLLISKRENIEEPKNDRFWDKDFDQSIYTIVDLKNGKSKLVAHLLTSSKSPCISPESKYVVYFDPLKGNYYSLDLKTLKQVNMCRGLKPWHFGARQWWNPVDKKSKEPEIGCGWWLKGDYGYLVYDNYDIWLLDPSGKRIPFCITNEYGQSHNIVFALLNKPSENSVLASDRILLNAYNLKTNYNGVYAKNIDSKGDPEKCSMDSCFMRSVRYTHFNNPGLEPLKAGDTNLWIVNRQTPQTGTNYYVTCDFKTFKPITFLKPFKEVNWYTRQVHRFKCLDGTDGEGILYIPENFDPRKKYPVIIPFYGRHACYLYSDEEPAYPSNPIVFATSPAWLLNHGYLVFVPNIKVDPLKGGPTSFSVLEGAAKYLQKLTFVDGKHIGACSHSMSSKFGAYLFTHSKHVKAMAINEGFAFGNLINTAFVPSEDGRSDLKAIEKEYGELWKHKNLWLDQTTIYNVDKAKMPLLLSCNSGGWEREYTRQGFEIFSALRRLNKPVWWFQYSSMEHSINSLEEQKDYAIRFVQFFDHYLKGAPSPQWMTRGLPYKLVGVEPRLALDPSGTCALPGKECPICKAWNAQYKKTPGMFAKPISEWKMDADIERDMKKEINKNQQ